MPDVVETRGDALTVEVHRLVVRTITILRNCELENILVWQVGHDTSISSFT
jgi:hypothetical protein